MSYYNKCTIFSRTTIIQLFLIYPYLLNQTLKFNSFDQKKKIQKSILITDFEHTIPDLHLFTDLISHRKLSIYLKSTSCFLSLDCLHSKGLCAISKLK